MKKQMFIVLLLLVVFLSGCGVATNDKMVSESRMDAGMSSQKANYSEEMEMASPDATTDSTSEDVKFPRKIIRNANLSFEVKDPNKTANAIETQVKQINGWIVESSISGNEQNTSVEMEVRIPAEELDPFIIWLKEEDGKLLHSRIYSDEITMEYYDVQARLGNARNQKLQYLEIMKKANTVEEVLQVQSYIDSVQERIESLSRQMEVWDLQVDFSKVYICLSQSPRIATGSKDPAWSFLSWGELGHRFRNGFVVFFNGLIVFLQEFFIQFFTIYLWIILILWGLWAIIRSILRSQKKKAKK